MCKHSSILTEQTCAICDGTVYRREEKQRQYKDARVARHEYNIKRKKLQELSMEVATDNNLPRTDELLKYILVNINGVERNDIDTLYDVAIQTKRTLGAIEWVWQFAFAENEKLNFKDGEERAIYIRIQGLKMELGI